ncbi:MAG TPA: type II CRISPR RNA-guided endonuclease Cas9 [Terracidiphilus sp.]|jgi:CRISPR-associated endonuclease Csn1|nr:type II CRISPR RNA-guided endonuclease Cas9 [Terracidiphilus sp.]
MFSTLETPQKYVLGLDLGSASLGWAMIALNAVDDPFSLIKTGVRIFEPGVDGTAIDIQEGKDQSKAVDRRVARLHRRQLRRRSARQRELFQLLQARNLLPVPVTGTGAGAEQRHRLLNELDVEIARKFASMEDSPLFDQMPLYRLRKRALDHALEPFELGRILFHLIQRRGFKSNRKETKKNDKENEDQGAVKADIHSLELEIRAAGARTLGEYFAGLNPHNPTNDPKLRVRRRWTSRKMFETEFALIWAAQSPYHPSLLTPELRDRVSQLLFFQRDIAEQKHLIGTCELERGDPAHPEKSPPKRRAPWAMMAAQRFRMLQKINDLKLIDPRKDIPISLAPEDRDKLYRLLDREGTQTFSALRKYLGIPKGVTFNLENGGDKNLPGNRTQRSMIKVFGSRWDEFTEGKQNQVIENWRNSKTDDALMQEAIDRLGLDAERAALLVKEKPATDYCALSLTAIEKLTPLMLQGRSFKDAETEVYGSRFSGLTVHDALPPVREVLPTLRNPAVERSMTELRKVVNSIVGKHGRPYEIRIELARELKKPRGERQKDTDKARKRQKQRESVAKKIFHEFGIMDPGRSLIEKALLYEECGGICPYTGMQMRYSSLVNDSEFDIEHIIPRSRFPDNSYQNKTLCYQSFNQQKANRTPYEVFQGSPEEYEKVLDRIRAWPIKNHGKLMRFRVGEPGLKEDNTLEGFSARQLNDTRYTSVAAAKLLATLYGGRDVKTVDGKRQAVFATSGAITAALRSTWGLEEILRDLVPPQPGDQRGKPRIDHRHHAIDAITIAATQPRVIQSMARDSSLAIDWRTRPKVPTPWKDFVPSIRPHIEQLLVSHRPEHKLTGELHDETNYGKPYKDGKKTMVHVRKRVTGLTEKDFPNIVDPAIREAVISKAQSLNGDLSACEIKSDWPLLPTRNGSFIPIKKVRMKKVLDVTPIGHGVTQRYVAESSNHHIAIYAQLDEHGKEKCWDGIIVSLLEAYDRLSEIKRSEAYRQHHRTASLVQRVLPDEPHQLFKFSLMGGDIVELHRHCDHFNNLCSPHLYRVRTIATNGQLSLVRITDARMKKEIQAAKDWWSPTADSLRKFSCRKVVVDLQGQRRYAND